MAFPLKTVAFAVVLTSCTIAATEEPSCTKWELRNVRLGMTVKDVRAHHPNVHSIFRYPVDPERRFWNLRSDSVSYGEILFGNPTPGIRDRILTDGPKARSVVIAFQISAGPVLRGPEIMDNLRARWGPETDTDFRIWRDADCSVTARVVERSITPELDKSNADSALLHGGSMLVIQVSNDLIMSVLEPFDLDN